MVAFVAPYAFVSAVAAAAVVYASHVVSVPPVDSVHLLKLA